MKVQILVLMEALDHQKKTLVLVLLKQTQNFVWVYIIMMIIVICLLMEKKIFKFKADNKNVNFPTQFYLVSISNGFSAIESREWNRVWFFNRCCRDIWHIEHSQVFSD